MNQPFSRISENVLFIALLAAAIGSSAMSLATAQPTAPTPAVSVVATTGISNS